MSHPTLITVVFDCTTFMLLKAAVTIIKEVVRSSEAVAYCKNKVERIGRRLGALSPSLEMLRDTLSSPPAAAVVDKRALQSLNDTMLHLLQVLQLPQPSCAAAACVFHNTVTTRSSCEHP